MLTYTVEFIDAAEAAVGENQGTCFKLPLTTILYTAMMASSYRMVWPCNLDLSKTLAPLLMHCV